MNQYGLISKGPSEPGWILPKGLNEPGRIILSKRPSEPGRILSKETSEPLYYHQRNKRTINLLLPKERKPGYYQRNQRTINYQRNQRNQRIIY